MAKFNYLRNKKFSIGFNNEWREQCYPKMFSFICFDVVKSPISILFDFYILGLGFYIGFNWGEGEEDN